MFLKFLYKRIVIFPMVFLTLVLLTAAEIDPYFEKYDTSSVQTDSIDCKSIDLHLVSESNNFISNDTFRVCVYDTITFHAAYTGENNYRYRWSNGASSPELKLFTTGIGNDIQKIWLDLIDLQTGCIYSDTLVVVYYFGACVGEKEIDSKWPVRFFPNPVRDVLFIEYTPPVSGLTQVLVYNMSGQVVFEKSVRNDQNGTNQLQLDLKFLPRGLYMIRLMNQQAIYTDKIILY